MSATVIPFAPRFASEAVAASLDKPPILTPAWAVRHLPLIEAALDLLHAEDGEFERRCRQIRAAEGPDKLDILSSQLERLGSHIADVADALGLTAERIRSSLTATAS